MVQMTEQLVQKLGLIHEPKIIGKTTELLRLLELRSTNVSATINEYAKIVICIDLAAVFLGLSFDQENALKLSGLRKTQYANNKRMFEKILDLNKLVGVNDICTKLGINEVAKKATEFLELYKNIIDSEATDIDITHPQYPAMAVYQACKINQKRVSKAKVMSFSHLRPSQWTQLELKWDKIIASHKINTVAKKETNSPEVQDKDKNEAQTSVKTIKRAKNPEIEDYEIWKRRMLAMSNIELTLQKEQPKRNKENIENIGT